MEFTWHTADGRTIPIMEMERHHAWNTLRLLKRRGFGNTYKAKALKLRLRHVPWWEFTWFKMRNVLYNVRFWEV